MRFRMDWKNSVFSDGTEYFVSNPLPKLGETIEIKLRMMADAPVEHVLIRYIKDGLEVVEEMEKRELEHGLQYYSCTVLMMEEKLCYHFYLVSGQGLYYYNQKGITDILPDEAYDFQILTEYMQPSWVQGSVFCQIFPDRFYRGDEKNQVQDGEYSFDGYPVQRIEDWKEAPKDFSQAHCLDFYGGDLKGVQEKLPYLQEFGVDALYLTPIFSAATVHRYDCKDYFHVDSHLGGDQALETLCQSVHDRNMKIILDISINHTGAAHSWFDKKGEFWSGAKDNAENAKAMPEFYYMEENGTYGSYGGVSTLPKLNYSSLELRDIIYRGQESILRKWLREPYAIDGWRFDVAATTGQYKKDHFQHEIWPEIRKVIKKENAEAYILAEDWNSAIEYLQGTEWDSIMNFAGCGRAVREYVGQLDFRHKRKNVLTNILPNGSAKALATRLTQFFGKLPQTIQQNQFNMLDCHDIARLHLDEKLSFEEYTIAVYIQYMLPGCVCIYYGDEIGLDGHTDSVEGCRYPMDWSATWKSNPYFALYKQMNELKHNYVALRQGSFKILYAEGKQFAVARFTKDEVVILVTSMEEETSKVFLQVKQFGNQFLMPETDLMGNVLTYEEGEEGVWLQIENKAAHIFLLSNKDKKLN